MPSPEIVPVVSAYTVCALPTDNANHHIYSIKVELTHDEHDTWAVRRMGRCLSTAGQWVYEPQPSSRDDTFLAEHRFDRDTALRHAVEQAPNVIVNGSTVADCLARHANRHARR